MAERPSAVLELQPLELQSLVTVNGQVGVFTPLTSKPGTPTNPQANDNAEAIISAMQRDNIVLRKELSELKAQSAQPSAPPRSPEDFASAVRRSLDKLQTSLSSMTNPVSNFAVRSFRLETQVRLQVSALGEVEYRFVEPDERPDAATLSKVTLEVTPLPKQSAVATFTPDAFKPDTGIEQIPGLKDEQLRLLHQHQIDAVGDFLAAGTRARSQLELVSLLKTDRATLASWLGSAELLTLQGIDTSRATVLLRAGISGLGGVAELTPAALIERFEAAHKQLPQLAVKAPSQEEAARWIQAASGYLGLKQAASP
jgi:hypothetical protein